MTLLFDVDKIHRHRQNASIHIGKYGFLAQAIECELADRVTTIDRYFNTALINGARTDNFNQLRNVRNIQYINAYNHLCTHIDYVHLSSIDNKFDLIVDSLKIHTISDIKRYLDIIKNHLTPQGLFVAAFYGGESLRELRQSILKAEIDLYQGAALRIIPMIDLNTALQLINHIGFKNPIVDREMLSVDYLSLNKILTDIKFAGESNPFAKPPQPMTYQHYKIAEQYYRSEFSDNDHKFLKATVEVIYVKCEI